MYQYFHYHNIQIAYSKQGAGDVVVLLHGFGEDSSIWDYQFDFLKIFFTVIVIDLPGSGRSMINNSILTINDGRLTENPSTIEFYAEVVNALLTHLVIEKCVMLGHSMGGYITLAFAEKYADKLDGFGLIHSTAYADSDEKKINRQRGIQMMEQYGSFAFLKTTIPTLFTTDFKTKSPNIIDGLLQKGKLFSVIALQNYYRAMMNRIDRTDVLKSSSLPILFIIGTDDIAVPLKDILQQSHMPNCSYIYILENIGHMGILEEPTKVNEFICSFVNSCFN